MGSKMKERVLIVAAHPDDEVLGCGGTIAKFRENGHDVRVVFLAEGVTSRYQPDEIAAPHVQKKSKIRNENAFKALEILSVPPGQVFVELRPCCRLDQVPMLDLVKQIEGHISQWKPTKLFTHAPYDANIDHRLTYMAVLAAGRPKQDSQLKSIYSFEVLSSTEWNPLQPFIPNIFVDINSVFDKKIKALEAYGDEMQPPPHPRSVEVVRSLATYRGAQAGIFYAEAFSLVRSIDVI